MGDSVRFCNNCKKNVSRANHATHTVHCQRNVITCSLCHEAVLRSQYQQHIESNHSSIKCEYCGEDVEGLKLFRHQKEECLQRLVACKYCEIEVISREIEAHLEYCGARTDRCKGCSKYVQSRHLQFHYEHDHKYLSPSEKEEADAVGSEGDDEDECPICLGPVTLPLALECGHVFCMVCVKGIANTTKNCAICRRDIQRDMLMDIRFCREEDIIKNYVNKPNLKKIGRSHSVPSKPSRRVAKTTQEYDDMVSALMSSRTSTANCRYQRPSNTHTPTPYTPYCYSTTTTSCSSSSDTRAGTAETRTCSDMKGAEIRCSTEETKTPETAPRPRVRKSHAPLPSAPTQSRSRPSPTPNKLARPSNSSESSSEESSSVSIPVGVRPRRPTTLALKKDERMVNGTSEEGAQSSTDSGTDEGHHLSQIEYDRWLAFQLARAEDDLPASEFNQKSLRPMRRSQSMPESKEGGSLTPKGSEDPSPKPCSRNDHPQSRLPPTSPRCSSATPVTSGVSSSTSNAHGSNLTKSSSDSSATGSNTSNGNSVSTGARPKSSSGLKKRVSFKEDVPPVKREAPVMLPCEFCEEMFIERDLMRHQTSCDKNETKNPREFLESRRSSVSSPTSPSKLLSPVPSVVSSKPPSLPLNRGSESPSRPTNKSLKTPPQSPSPRPKQTSSSPSFITRSPSITHLTESDNSQTNSRHTSVSPGPGASISSSSGIGSATSSFSSSSVSTTPSTSSSASPVPTPAAPDTPTDNEGELEEEEVHLPRPRRGRLLSSAIASWRSISGGKHRERPRYTRSNTAPMEFTDEGELIQTSGVSMSFSASQLPPIPPPVDKNISSTTISNEKENQEIENENGNQQVFVKSKNKYPAPAPPKPGHKDKQIKNHELMIKSEEKQTKEKISKIEDKQTNLQEKETNIEETHTKVHDNQTKSSTISQTQKSRKQKDTVKEKVFKFDSKPIMNGNLSDETIPCEFCKAVFPPEKFQNHKAVCKAMLEDQKSNSPRENEKRRRNASPSSARESSLQGHHKAQQEETPLPRRHNKGPAPKPPHKGEGAEPLIRRSNSVRERSSSCVRSYDFEGPSRRLERASSIRETSYHSRETSPLSRRWSWSREGLYSSRGGLDSAGAYSGDNSLSSSTTSLNSYSMNTGRSSYSSTRDDFWSRRSVTSLGLTNFPASLFLGGTRSITRDRPLSRHRPSSFYGSRPSFHSFGDSSLYLTDKRRLLR